MENEFSNAVMMSRGGFMVSFGALGGVWWSGLWWGVLWEFGVFLGVYWILIGFLGKS
jgi:hypothetical protein